MHFPDSEAPAGGAIAQLDNFVYGIIRKRRETASGSNDLLSMLLQARYEDGGRLTDVQLRDEIVTFFLRSRDYRAGLIVGLVPNGTSS